MRNPHDGPHLAGSGEHRGPLGVFKTWQYGSLGMGAWVWELVWNLGSLVGLWVLYSLIGTL